MVAWIAFQKRKWEFQKHQREHRGKRLRRTGDRSPVRGSGKVVRDKSISTIGGFLRRVQRTLLDLPWQIIQVSWLFLDSRVLLPSLSSAYCERMIVSCVLQPFAGNRPRYKK